MAGLDGAAPGAPRTVTADELLERCVFPPSGRPLTCAVSGGADSLALLVLAVEAGCDVTAVHVDHGLRAGSVAEADVVADAAARLGAGFRGVRVDVGQGPNLEARARAARLGALPPGSATGHTMDDQAETVLVNLLRGSGLDGLAGMRPGPGHPLLAIRRWQTRALCALLGLEPVEDPSNEDRRFVRNRVRHELLPLANAIAGRDIVPVLARQAALLGDEAGLLDELASGIDPADSDALNAAPSPLARRATRHWLQGPAPHPPDMAAVERVLAVARGQMPATDVAPGVRVRRRRGALSAEPVAPETSGSVGAR
jgi:tRNA(Ile)-lysidine synthase